MSRNIPVIRPHRESGFSLVETGVLLSIATIIAGYALLNMTGLMPGIRANTALNATVAQLRNGRALAMAQRRNIEIRFLGTDQIQLVRREVPTGTTVLSTVTLQDNMQFFVFDGIPDTPDSFGNSSAVDFSGATSLIYLSDGTLVDAQGDPLSGSVFLGRTNYPRTARAITILGATGRVRGYRWTGSSWIPQ